MHALLNARRTGVAFVATAALLVVGLAPGTANAHPGGAETREVHELLKTLKKSTSDLKKVEDAMNAGYLPEGPCVEVPGLGAMGVHYVNGALVDGIVDAEAPEVLVFMPDERGRLDLVAVEFLTVGLAEAPEIAGITFEPGPFPGSHARHAWIYEKNPSGTFAAFNPAISCP
jgi:hypothetical protein